MAASVGGLGGPLVSGFLHRLANSFQFLQYRPYGVEQLLIKYNSELPIRSLRALVD